MLISAVADIHCPSYLDLFLKNMESARKPDLLLLAGDICEIRRKEEYRTVLNIIRKNWGCPIVACFGNTEFDEEYDEIRKMCRDIIFLEDESTILKISGKEVGIVGTKGCLDEPTFWQRKYYPQIYEFYRDRLEKTTELLKQLKTEIKILLMHYSPTYKTLEGENPNIYSSLGCKKFEAVTKETNPTLVVHGHAHMGTPLAFIDSTPIFNVSLPVNKKIVEIDPDSLPKPGLKKFI